MGDALPVKADPEAALHDQPLVVIDGTQMPPKRIHTPTPFGKNRTTGSTFRVPGIIPAVSVNNVTKHYNS
jgi:hypothetical protein